MLGHRLQCYLLHWAECCVAGAAAAAGWGLTAMPGQVPDCTLSHPWGRCRLYNRTDRSGLILEKGTDGAGKWQHFRMCRCYLPQSCFQLAAWRGVTGILATLASPWDEGPSSPIAGGGRWGGAFCLSQTPRAFIPSCFPVLTPSQV